MAHPKIDDATTVALEAIRDAAPGLLSLTQAAEKVAENAAVSVGTARNRLRAAIEAGGLLELKPQSYKFFIDLPGAEGAGVGPFYIAREWISASREARKVITTDDSKARPSSYGPGNTTYVADPEQIREYVQQLADEKKAKDEADRQARKDDRVAQQKEIERRFPGLRRALRKLSLFSPYADSPDSPPAFTSPRVFLDTARGQGESAPVTERIPNVSLVIEGDDNVAIFHSILEAGIAAHVGAQPSVSCRHCGYRILHTTGKLGTFWWHVATSNVSCAEGDTKAEPAKES